MVVNANSDGCRGKAQTERCVEIKVSGSQRERACQVVTAEGNLLAEGHTQQLQQGFQKLLDYGK